MKLAVLAYSEMASMLSEGNIMVAMAMSAWISTMIGSLVRWGVLTDEEHQLLVQELNGLSEDVEPDENNEPSEDTVRSFVQRHGI